MGFSVFDSAGRLKVTPQLVDLALEVSGTLPVKNGGTGLVTLAAGRIPYGFITGALASTGAFVFDGTKLTFPGQLQFPAAISASADANCLDDYEEGAWTPGDGSGAALSITVVSARYVKVGGHVYVAADILYPVTANGANARINGLPFTTHAAQQCAMAPGYLTFGAAVTYLVRANNTVVDIFTTAGVNVTNVQISGTNIILSGTYPVPV